jgi:hypothetical protein
MLNSLRCGVGNKAVAAEEFHIQQRQRLMLDTLIRARIDIKCGIIDIKCGIEAPSFFTSYIQRTTFTERPHACTGTCM